MKIGEKIRNAREDLDLTQEEVASQIPMNQSSYSKIERNVQEPNLDQLRRICEILQLNPSYLLSLEPFPNNISEKDIQFSQEIRKLLDRFYNT